MPQQGGYSPSREGTHWKKDPLRDLQQITWQQITVFQAASFCCFYVRCAAAFSNPSIFFPWCSSPGPWTATINTLQLLLVAVPLLNVLTYSAQPSTSHQEDRMFLNQHNKMLIRAIRNLQKIPKTITVLCVNLWWNRHYIQQLLLGPCHWVRTEKPFLKIVVMRESKCIC